MMKIRLSVYLTVFASNGASLALQRAGYSPGKDYSNARLISDEKAVAHK
jgi:hypothetical protein